MSPKENLIRYIDNLRLHDATVSKLSFCSSKKPAKVKAWVEELRQTKTSETSAVLYSSLPEFSRLKIDPETRLEMLEAVRPATQHAIEGLTGAFINRSVTSSASAQKTAIIAQGIQKAMIDGYCRCVADFCRIKRFRPAQVELLVTSLHRAISGIGLVFFRSYQLYSQPPTGFWLHLHALFQIADHFDLLAKPVKDALLNTTRATNIQTAYMRVLLMGTAKLNQISQKNVALVYDAFELWAQYGRLHTSHHQDKDIFYIVNISADQPPTYKSRFDGKSTDRILQLNFKVLVSLLSKHSRTNSSQPAEDEIDHVTGKLPVPAGFPDSLMDHLLNCWSSISQRRQERRDVQTVAEVCVGLVNTHYYVSGKQAFDDFTGQSDLDGGRDVLSTLSSSMASPFTDAPKGASEQVPTHSVSVQNVSAGGCCLLWKEDIPPKLQSGELIGIKEKGRHSWSIGVVRWIRQFKGISQLGIQTLASHPKPFGAGQMYDMGGYSDYARAFYIPAQKNGQNPASIITAYAPFKETDKVKIYDGESIFTVKLTKTLFSTSSVRQFAYHPLDSANKETKPRKAGNQSFDSDWN
ncbi:hypothetical protein [Teredinibacter purpureus]|uniref:hypothetical protein n=1 Tax=Teredinibacter purpureus TaxID=2731756 RepID=UPI0005F7ADC5|nr:hypothetical protein [Teredinibacter purpureus]